MRLAQLLDRTGLDVLDHLEREVTVPIIDGPQAQGDLIVIPFDLLGTVTLRPWSGTRAVPAEGVELVRGVAGNNPHTLVADPGTCTWTTGLRDAVGLSIGMFANTAPAYLIHPEHGGSGVAPGRWLVRRQQEYGRGGTPGRLGSTVLVAD
ncbi:MAG TPA: hypothetical protein VHX38_41455 [Pseudonocardiaceae bacterium]|jgi:hypothetical protein|nr:hypothetical protein [Pseudonocardiaceae bacterium]